MVKNLPAMWETWDWSLGQEDALEKGMASHSSILAWEIPWTEEPGRLVRGLAKSQKWLSNWQHTTQQNKNPRDAGLGVGFVIPLGVVVSAGLGVWSLFCYPLTVWPWGMPVPFCFLKFMHFILLLSFYFIYGLCRPWGHKESDTTEPLSLSLRQRKI